MQISIRSRMPIALMRVVIVAGIEIIDFGNESLPFLTRALSQSLADRLRRRCGLVFGDGRGFGARLIPMTVGVADVRLAAMSSRVSLHSE